MVPIEQNWLRCVPGSPRRQGRIWAAAITGTQLETGLSVEHRHSTPDSRGKTDMHGM